MPVNILNQFVEEVSTKVKFNCLDAASGGAKTIQIDFDTNFDENELDIIREYGHFHKVKYSFKMFNGQWTEWNNPMFSYVSTVVNKTYHHDCIKCEGIEQSMQYRICNVLARMYSVLSLHDIYLCSDGYIHGNRQSTAEDAYVHPYNSEMSFNIHPNPAPDADKNMVHLYFYYNIEETYYGYVDSGHTQDFICNDDEYVMVEDTVYISVEVAESHGCEYRECCDMWVSRRDYNCCDEFTQSGSEFDNCWKQTYRKSNLTTVNLRKTSGMSYTYGIEIETCSSRNVTYDGDLNLKAVYDGSVNGLEYVTGQLQGNMGVEMINKITNHLNYCDAKIDKTCGLHVHIGGANFNRRFSIMLLKLCYAIEDDIYSILPESRRTNRFCKLLPGELIDSLNFHNYKKTLGKFIANQDINRNCNKSRVHPGGRYNSERYHWVNITNYSTRTGPETVEFRPHSGTIDFTKIYNWLLICMSIVKFAENRQRRIWNNGMSSVPITLTEVLKYSLNKDLFESVYEYCKDRATKFGHTLR